MTRLYLSLLDGLDNVYPPIISSSVSVIEADPVVSITNLYLPDEYGKNPLQPLISSLKFSITFLDVSKTAFVSNKFISDPPEKGVTCVIQTCEASLKLCKSKSDVAIPFPYLSSLK